MFEPVHGSAPDIAGKGIANPVATIWSVQLMLDFLGEKKAAASLMKSIESITAEGFCTPDLGGDARMTQVTDRIIKLF
jgi:tartrate dehydrogenase/decarboxylase/D-malate dehydrogenase